MKQKLSSIALILAVLIVAGFGCKFLFDSSKSLPDEESGNFNLISEPKNENDKFRDAIVNFIRSAAEGYFSEQLVQHPEELKIEGDWKVQIAAYSNGEIRGTGNSENDILSLALEEAAQKSVKGGLAEKDLKNVRFKVDFLRPLQYPFSFIEYNGEGKELILDMAPVRYLDKGLISEKINQGKEFLLRAIDEETGGFHKKYYALKDYYEDRVHSVYSASIIYTFLYIYDFEKDKALLENLSDWGEFLLFMQNRNEGDRRYGAFHYSYFADAEEREESFPIGTSALNIFTLLRMYKITGENKYLEASRLAGDWLITMQRPDGTMKPYTEKKGEKWVYGIKESLLYEGQTLSSLSKLYAITEDQRYYDAAEKLANRFAQKYEDAQGYVVGEYRTENPISNSWVVMSLMDFYKISGDSRYKKVVFELSSLILDNQVTDENDLLNHGRWEGAYSTSGIGWISEVMTDTYAFCLEEGRNDCEKYKEAVVRGIRWIIQSTYTKENSFLLKNPENAVGGIFWNKDNRYVRTDSICHGLNAYTRIFKYLEDELLISIPEKSLEEILEDFLIE